MARKNNALNPRQVDTLGDGFHADGDNLYLRVKDEGYSRSWVFRFVRGGKVTSMGLGRAGQGGVSLADARFKARALNDTLDGGVNPLAARRERQQAEAARKTLSEAAAAYIEEKNRQWSASSRDTWRRFVDRDIEVIADIPVDTLGREDIKRAVHALGQMTGKGNRKQRPGAPAARLLQQRIQTVLGYASECGWRPENARYRWSMVAGRANREAERHYPALMPPEEKTLPEGLENAEEREERDEKDTALAALIVEAITRLRASDSVSARCLEFIALTAVRVSEATGAKWSEFNFRTKVWTIPVARMKVRGKKRRDHTVPLSDRALAIIAEAAQRRVSDYVFPGHRDGAPISRNTIYDMCDRVTGGRASPHGWRATFRTWATSNGVSYEAAEICLAHAGGMLAKAYQRGGLLGERRKPMTDWAKFLSGEDQETGAPDDGNIVNFPKRALPP